MVANNKTWLLNYSHRVLEHMLPHLDMEQRPAIQSALAINIDNVNDGNDSKLDCSQQITDKDSPDESPAAIVELHSTDQTNSAEKTAMSNMSKEQMASLLQKLFAAQNLLLNSEKNGHSTAHADPGLPNNRQVRNHSQQPLVT